MFFTTVAGKDASDKYHKSSSKGINSKRTAWKTDALIKKTGFPRLFAQVSRFVFFWGAMRPGILLRTGR
jgi:hypothetical protein